MTHGSKIRYVMGGSNDIEPGAPPMQAYWLAFVRTGNPNVAGLPSWKRYDQARRTYLGFVNGGPQSGNNVRGAVCGLRVAP